eukprot:COSAG02_NODE_7639_length_2921_cov_2.272147_2_plen_106_part_00
MNSTGVPLTVLCPFSPRGKFEYSLIVVRQSVITVVLMPGVTHIRDAGCVCAAGRYLDHTQLSGTLPSSVGDLTALSVYGRLVLSNTACMRIKVDHRVAESVAQPC